MSVWRKNQVVVVTEVTKVMVSVSPIRHRNFHAGNGGLNKLVMIVVHYNS